MALEEGRGWVQGIIFVPDEWDMSEVQAELFLHFKKCYVCFACLYVSAPNVCASFRGQGKVSGPGDCRALGTEPGSSAGAAGALNHEPGSSS